MISTIHETTAGRAEGGTAGGDGLARDVAGGVAQVLALAATPTFAIMAALSALPGGGPVEMFCAGASNGSTFTGMVVMYGLMSAFHAAPWLRLMASRPRRR